MPGIAPVAQRWLRPLCIVAAALALASCGYVQAGPSEPRGQTLHPPQRDAPAETGPGRDRPDRTLDTTQDPWKKIPFHPQDFWDWLPRNAS